MIKVIGTGSGRCGTTSLAELLDKQPCIVSCTHELFRFNIPYPGSQSSKAQGNALAKAMIENEGCDVALQWLWYASIFINAGYKIICLQRNKRETIKSFERKLTPFAYNHFSEKDGNPSPWDQCFPKFKERTLKVGVNKYYDMFYFQARFLARQSDRFRIFDSSKVLNNAEAQKEMLNWIGIEDPVIDTGIRKNALA